MSGNVRSEDDGIPVDARDAIRMGTDAFLRIMRSHANNFHSGKLFPGGMMFTTLRCKHADKGQR